MACSTGMDGWGTFAPLSASRFRRQRISGTAKRRGLSPASGPVHNGDEECFSVALHPGFDIRMLGSMNSLLSFYNAVTQLSTRPPNLSKLASRALHPHPSLPLSGVPSPLIPPYLCTPRCPCSLCVSQRGVLINRIHLSVYEHCRVNMG